MILSKLKTAFIIYQYYGFRSLCKAVQNKLQGRELLSDLNLPPYSGLKDVLFISGCNPKTANALFRYRILHQQEQLEAAGISTEIENYELLNPQYVRSFRTIIFYRCPYTDCVGEAVSLAKKLNKQILFDVDDLVIDTKYTDTIPFVQNAAQKDRDLFNDGVVRMGKTFRMCSGAITTTTALAAELEKYVSPVFINRNCASEQMICLSEAAFAHKKKHDGCILGYFSGSLTHNADFDLIRSALVNAMKQDSSIKLLLLGPLAVPDDFKEVKDQILHADFVPWQKLPEMISSVDINLAPLENTLFNNAKSENKWMEAALVKVPTIASNTGAFQHAITHNVTGLLCSTSDEWYQAILSLAKDPLKRMLIAENAYQQCIQHYHSLTSGGPIARFLLCSAPPRIGFVFTSLPENEENCIYEHASLLQDAGWIVEFLIPTNYKTLFHYRSHSFHITNFKSESVQAHFTCLVATDWKSSNYVLHTSMVEHKAYYIQTYETLALPYGDKHRAEIECSYYNKDNWRFFTSSDLAAELSSHLCRTVYTLDDISKDITGFYSFLTPDT